MIQILVHTCRGLGCSIFVEINVKRQSNPSPLKVLNIQHCPAHIQPSTIISKYHFKKCVPFRHNSRGYQCQLRKLGISTVRCFVNIFYILHSLVYTASVSALLPEEFYRIAAPLMKTSYSVQSTHVRLKVRFWGQASLLSSQLTALSSLVNA